MISVHVQKYDNCNTPVASLPVTKLLFGNKLKCVVPYCLDQPIVDWYFQGCNYLRALIDGVYSFLRK